jgi:uncharacterized protein DUF6484
MGKPRGTRSNLLRLLPAGSKRSTGPAIPLATLVEVNAEGGRVAVGKAPPRAARTTILLTPNMVGRTVTLGFEDGDPDRPLITGVIRMPEELAKAGAGQVHVAIDGKTLVLTAKDRIELRCGESTVRLTADGKVLVRGVHVVTRASGQNRIKGGSVQIN